MMKLLIGGIGIRKQWIYPQPPRQACGKPCKCPEMKIYASGLRKIWKQSEQKIREEDSVAL